MVREGKSFISNPKDKGWQFRTPEQFAAEQAVIKALKKKPEQVKRTPRKFAGPALTGYQMDASIRQSGFCPLTHG
jgi:hypothetical protein